MVTFTVNDLNKPGAHSMKAIPVKLVVCHWKVSEESLYKLRQWMYKLISQRPIRVILDNKMIRHNNA